MDTLSSTLTVDTVVDALLLADKYSVSNLKSKCIDYILKNAHDVTHTNAWDDMASANPKLNVEVVRKLAAMTSNLSNANTSTAKDRTISIQDVQNIANSYNASRPIGAPYLQLTQSIFPSIQPKRPRNGLFVLPSLFSFDIAFDTLFFFHFRMNK